MLPRPKSHSKLWNYRYNLLAALFPAVFLAVFSWKFRWNWSLDYDIWLHLSALRELMRHPFSPGNPVFSPDHPLSLLPFKDFTPHYWLLALWGRFWGWSAVKTFWFGGLVNFLLLSFFTQLFIGEWLADRRQAAISWLCLVFLWSGRWHWSAVYSFDTLLFTAGYPSAFGFTLVMVFGWCRVRGMRSERRKKPVWQAGAGAALAVLWICSPVLLPLAFGLAWALPGSVTLKKGIGIAGLFLLAGLIGWLWPFYNPGKLLMEIDFSKKYFDSWPVFLKPTILPLLLGAAGLAGVKDKTHKKKLAWGMAVFGVMAIFFFFMDYSIALYGRMLLNAVFFSQIAISLILYQWAANSPRPLAGWLVVFLIALNVRFLLSYTPVNHWVKTRVDDLTYIGKLVGDRETVLSDYDTSRVLSVFGPRVMVGYSYPDIFSTRNHSDISGLNQAVGSIFGRRIDRFMLNRLLYEFRIKYILLNRRSVKTAEPFREYGKAVYQKNGLLLIQVKSRSPWEPLSRSPAVLPEPDKSL